MRSTLDLLDMIFKGRPMTESTNWTYLTELFQNAAETVVFEVSQNAFWYQVLAIVSAVILSLIVSKVLGKKLQTWEEYF